jgi:hypothetical protein
VLAKDLANLFFPIGMLSLSHPGVELRANLKSTSHRCHIFEVAFVWELTK